MDESRLSKKTEMIIDCHCHSGKGDGLRSVFFAAFHSDYGAANEEVAHIVRSWPDRFLGFAFVNPRMTAVESE